MLRSLGVATSQYPCERDAWASLLPVSMIPLTTCLVGLRRSLASCRLRLRPQSRFFSDHCHSGAGVCLFDLNLGVVRSRERTPEYYRVSEQQASTVRKVR
jgi:hypothetical protein